MKPTNEVELPRTIQGSLFVLRRGFSRLLATFKVRPEDGAQLPPALRLLRPLETDRVNFQTRFDLVALDWAEAQEFKRRASLTSGGDVVVEAIDAGIASPPVLIADEDKALELLNAWLEEVGEDSVSSELRELRDTLALDHEVEG